MQSVFIGTILSLALISIPALAEQKLVQGRVFGGTVSVKPTELNTLLTSENLKNVDSLLKVGAEITFPLLGDRLNVGLRYQRQGADIGQVGTGLAAQYPATLVQDVAMGVVRVPLLKSGFFMIDVFAGLGGSNTTFKIESGTQNGELSRKVTGDWFASPFYAYGASVAVGYNNIYLALEAGLDNNEIKDFDRSGTVSNNLQSMNLGGSYAVVSLVFDGTPVFSK